MQLAAGTGIFGISKMNYVVFTTEFVGESTEAPAVCEIPFDFPDFVRCAGCGGVSAVSVSNYVVKTT